MLIKDNQVITEQQFIALHPNTSFGPQIPYSDFGYSVIAPQGQPTFDPITQSIREGAPTYDGSHWLQTWEIVQLDEATVAANRAAQVVQDNERIKQQIAALEAGQQRAVREVALGGDKTRLTKLDNDIAALRGQLK